MNYPNQMETERKELLRILTLYRRLPLQQMFRFFPQIQEDILLSLLRQFQKQGRLSLKDSFVCCLPEVPPEDGMTAALEVMLDFFPEVTYHSPGDFPITLTFFAREEEFDVIWLPEGKELILSQALSLQPEPSSAGHTLIVLSNHRQLSFAPILPQTAAFCLAADGHIQYFKKQQGEHNGPKDIKRPY